MQCLSSAGLSSWQINLPPLFAERRMRQDRGELGKSVHTNYRSAGLQALITPSACNSGERRLQIYTAVLEIYYLNCTSVKLMIKKTSDQIREINI